MPTIRPFAFAAAPGYGLPPASLENHYVQETPSGPVQFALLPRPGLTLLRTVGTGPTRGKFAASGVFGGDDFTVSGTVLFRNATSLGTIAGTGRCFFAASATELVIVGGGIAYRYNGTTLTVIADVDLPANVSGVAFMAGRFIYTNDDTDQFYYSAVGDATDIDGLAFATAEQAPDPNLGVITLGDELVFPGAETMQFWFATGNDDTPFQPTQNRSYQRGTVAMASVVPIDNTLLFVGDDRIVYRADNVPIRVSDHAVEKALQACTTPANINAVSVPWQGHSFYLLNIPGQGSWALDMATKSWAVWTSFGRTTFRCNTASVSNGTVTLGDDANGKQFTLSTAYRDDDLLITRKASVFVPQEAGEMAIVGPICLQGAVGVGLDVGDDPICQMRLSRDRGNTYTDWRDASLGLSPSYLNKPFWHRNGRIFSPGLLIEFKCTEGVLTSWWGVTIGEVKA